MSLHFIPISPEEIFDELRHLSFPIWICGGWAIEMFVGSPIRKHHDMDVAILRADHAKLKTELPDWEFKIAKDGILHEWSENELPPNLHALWARKQGREKWITEFLVNESEGSMWVFRKNKLITSPLADIGLLNVNVIPYFHPSIPLLFKSAHCRENDTIDFNAALPRMNNQERTKLKEWISIFHPECEWQQKL